MNNQPSKDDLSATPEPNKAAEAVTARDSGFESRKELLQPPPDQSGQSGSSSSHISVDVIVTTV